MTPFCPQHVKDLAGEVSEAPDWRIHGLLPRVTLALLAAYPKVGKSTFAGQLSVAVAQGRDFLGRRASRGGVLYVVAEEQRDDVIRRLRLLGMNDETDPIYISSSNRHSPNRVVIGCHRYLSCLYEARLRD